MQDTSEELPEMDVLAISYKLEVELDPKYISDLQVLDDLKVKIDGLIESLLWSNGIPGVIASSELKAEGGLGDMSGRYAVWNVISWAEAVVPGGG